MAVKKIILLFEMTNNYEIPPGNLCTKTTECLPACCILAFFKRGVCSSQKTLVHVSWKQPKPINALKNLPYRIRLTSEMFNSKGALQEIIKNSSKLIQNTHFHVPTLLLSSKCFIIFICLGHSGRLKNSCLDQLQELYQVQTWFFRLTSCKPIAELVVFSHWTSKTSNSPAEHNFALDFSLSTCSLILHESTTDGIILQTS